MNWRLSALDRFVQMSNSDAHSPEKLGREANLFDCELSYFALRDALRSERERFLGTIEFFPEEGKYHFDGHRKCGVVFAPEETRAAGGLCPKCGHRLTSGVLGRVVELADRPAGFRPDGAKPFQSLVPLMEVLGEVLEAGPAAACVRQTYERLLARVGPELAVLSEAPVEDLRREGPPLIAEALERIRGGRVHLSPGYDGEYGVVRAFDEAERRALLCQKTFAFGWDPAPALPSEARETTRETTREMTPDLRAPARSAAAGPAPSVNPEQSRVVAHGEGPLLIVAGPGTGKTSTLVERIVHLVRSGAASARTITAITFTRKAAGELKERLAARMRAESDAVTASTFHAFGLDLLRARSEEAGLPRDFAVLDEAARLRLVASAIETARSDEEREGRSAAKMAERIGWAKAHLRSPEEAETAVASVYLAYERALAAQGALDFDDLVLRAVRLLEKSPQALAFAHDRCRWLFVDEYQDINPAQYALVRLVAPAGANLCVVGDPDQSIYGFRGSDPSYFARFSRDYPGANAVTLTRNYRSPASVVEAATRVIEQSPGRAVRALVPADAARTPIERFVGEDAWDEAEWIAREIERAVGGTSLEGIRACGGASAAPIAFHDVAILTRTSAQMDVIADALSRSNLPFRRAGHEALAARPGVGELLTELSSLLEQSGKEAPSGSSCPRAELAAAIGRRPASEIVVRLGALVNRADASRHAAVELCAMLGVPFGHDLSAFMAAAPLLQETDLRLEAQKIALLTLHASKGLEFPLVFIAGCEDHILPLTLFGSCDVDEERRLLYVGMTRAKGRLVLTAAKRRTLLGRTNENGPCPFLESLPSAWLQEMRANPRRKRNKQLSLL
jgi:superfamily I DNA/RNA helicase